MFLEKQDFFGNHPPMPFNWILLGLKGIKILKINRVLFLFLVYWFISTRMYIFLLDFCSRCFITWVYGRYACRGYLFAFSKNRNPILFITFYRYIFFSLNKFKYILLQY